MSDTLEHGVAVMEELGRQSAPGIDGAITLNCIGTIGAGKSTFLAGVHQELGYSSVGVHIERGRSMNLAELMGHRLKGITRGSATVGKVDRMAVYGRTSNGIVKMQLCAPGSHSTARQLSVPEDAVAFFLDLMLYQRTVDLLQKREPIEFFPFRGFRGRHPAGHTRRSEAENVEQEYAQMPEVFKRTEIGVVVESLLCAQEYLTAVLQRAIPIVGIQTYPSQDQPSQNGPMDAAIADGGFNRLIERYMGYIEKKGFPYGTSNWSGNQAEHNDRVTRVGLARAIGSWYLVDSVPEVRKGVKEAMYAFAVAALQQRGIDAEGFRLLRFSKRQLDGGDDGITEYHNVKKKKGPA